MKPKVALGGCVVCRPVHYKLKNGESLGLQLMSDLHIGAPQVNYPLINSELKSAQKRGDRILINGDLLDAIVASDRKRFRPNALHPRLRGRNDILNTAIEWAVEILTPYADLIDMIGVGNHETAIEHHHSLDATRVIIYELSKKVKDKKHVIHYGGYTGFVDYRVNNCRWVLFYTHGHGGNAEVTRGMIDFNRKSTFVVADCFWLGHKHNRFNGSQERIYCSLGGPNVLVDQFRYVMTGAYFKTYVGQSQQSIKKHGRLSNYAADAAMIPQGQGGARIVLKPHHTRTLKVSVEQ